MIVPANIDPIVFNELVARVNDKVQVINGTKLVSDYNQTNIWIRVASGVDTGLILESNQFQSEFLNSEHNSDAFIRKMYGTSQQSGTIGVDFNGKEISADLLNDLGFRGRPVIDSIEIEDNSGDSGYARGCKFQITCNTIAQLDKLKKYFFEPGNIVFVDWGMYWPGKTVSRPTLNVNTIADFYDYTKVLERQRASGGLYDCYIGFIKGGGVTINDDSFTLNVELIGISQLAAFQKINSDIKSDDEIEKERTKNIYSESFITAESAPEKKRFMYMFNELPSNFQSDRTKKLMESVKLEYFINFEPNVEEEINSNIYSTFAKIGNWLGLKNDGSVGKLIVPAGETFITSQKFINFGFLIDILNVNIPDQTINGKSGINKIKIDDVKIGAFQSIFSHDGSKLFIPNKNTPWLDIGSLSDLGKIPETSAMYNKIKDNTVGPIMFPSLENSTFDNITLNSGEWGYLKNLYVNFETVANYMNMPNLNNKDLLYMILNGISSAVSGFWNFQLVENPTTGYVEIVDRNLFIKFSKEPKYFDFKLFGVKSIVKDIGFDISLSSEQMNRIIYSKRQQLVNSEQSDVIGKSITSATNDKILEKIQIDNIKQMESKPAVQDKIKKEMEDLKPYLDRVPAKRKIAISQYATIDDDVPLSTRIAEAKRLKAADLKAADEKQKTSNRLTLIKTFTFAPAINTPSSGISDLGAIYVTSINDKILFNAKKNKQHNVSLKTESKFSPILPVRLEFTTIGISGLKRCDLFTVSGLPVGYGAKYGVFQIVNTTQNISSDGWYTTVSAQFKQLTALEDN